MKKKVNPQFVKACHVILYAGLALTAIGSGNYLAAVLAISLISLIDLNAKQLEVLRLQHQVIQLLEIRVRIAEQNVVKEHLESNPPHFG